MPSPTARLIRWCAAAAALTAVAGCIISRGVRATPLPAGTSDSAAVRSPVKAHLADGGTVVFRDGATVARDTAVFTPSTQTLVRAMRERSTRRDSMERQFFRSRIPVQ